MFIVVCSITVDVTINDFSACNPVIRALLINTYAIRIIRRTDTFRRLTSFKSTLTIMRIKNIVCLFDLEEKTENGRMGRMGRVPSCYERDG